MANPSLQIGNDNWAIKEDNLLGYSTAGTRFVPQPITMTRATLGTRVNPSGLVEDVALLGSEEVVNGDFDTTIPLGNTGSGWGSIVGDVVYYNGGVKLTRVSSTNRLRARTITGSDNILTQGKQYLLYYSVLENNNCTSFKAYHGGSSTTLNNTLGNHTIYFTQDSSDQVFQFTNNTNNSNITIDNVSVKEATIDNLPRVDYTDGTSSLLVEPQRTNLVTYSESISNLSSNTNGTGTFTITDNYTDSPQGVQNASRVQMSIVDTDDTNNYRLINTGSVMTTGVTREISFYAKSLTGSNQDVLVYWSYDQQIVTLTNDWQRFKISATSGNTGSIFIGTRGGSGNYYSGGDGNLDFALWGLQVEDDGSGGGSSYATSYIKTSGSTVTRNQETYTKTGISDLINSEEGCVFGEGNFAESDSGSGYFYFVSLSDGTPNNRLEIRQSNTNLQFLWRVATYQDNIITSGVDVSSNFKFALSYSSSNIKFYVNGNPIGTINTPTLWSADTLNRMAFDNGSGGDILSGKVKQLQIFKTALSDSELATLTT